MALILLVLGGVFVDFDWASGLALDGSGVAKCNRRSNYSLKLV